MLARSRIDGPDTRLTIGKMKQASATSRVSSKGQIVIPEPVRSAMKIEQGDRLEWSTAPDGSCVVRKAKGRLEDLVGVLGKPATHRTLEQLDAAVRAKLRTARDRR